MEIPSDFCNICGNLLDMPMFGKNIECNKCQWKIPIEEFVSIPILTVIEFKDKKQWLERYHEEQQQVQAVQKEKIKNKATIVQECPKCGHNLMHFWTVQIRSVDEGSTVFYQCPECDFTFTQNN